MGSGIVKNETSSTQEKNVYIVKKGIYIHINFIDISKTRGRQISLRK